MSERTEAPVSVTEIGDLFGATATSVIIPDPTTAIGTDAFGNNQLTSATVHESAFSNNPVGKTATPTSP